MNYSTLVFCAPTKDALEAVVRPVWDQVPFSSDKTKARIVAASWSLDAMSVLDAVTALVDCHSLDGYELRDCLGEITKLRTWEECLAKFAEWEMEYRDGDLVDLREEEAA